MVGVWDSGFKNLRAWIEVSRACDLGYSRARDLRFEC